MQSQNLTKHPLKLPVRMEDLTSLKYFRYRTPRFIQTNDSNSMHKKRNIYTRVRYQYQVSHQALFITKAATNSPPPFLNRSRFYAGYCSFTSLTLMPFQNAESLRLVAIDNGDRDNESLNGDSSSNLVVSQQEIVTTGNGVLQKKTLQITNSFQLVKSDSASSCVSDSEKSLS